MLLVLLACSLVTYKIDSTRISKNKKPLFVVATDISDDDEKTTYIGLGYKIIEWNRINGKETKYYKISTIFNLKHIDEGQPSSQNQNNDIKELSLDNFEIKSDPNAEDLIKNVFKYKNERNLDLVKSCYNERSQNNNFNLDNIETVELLDIKLSEDKSAYKSYLKNPVLKEFPTSIDELLIYEVKYNIKFKDDSIEPIGSGTDIKHYYLIKYRNSGKWLINDVGD
ncbi:MAG: DUF4829 domain-containing protein [Clostridium sp.]|uniref:DUF4829 domain-containing protein n=1 Tax=Clostridium sp. TaxID=1506 RepID=UPI003F2C81DC